MADRLFGGSSGVVKTDSGYNALATGLPSTSKLLPISKILNWANAQVGKSTFRANNKTYQSRNYCQAFVSACYAQAFGYEAVASAAEARKRFLIKNTQNVLEPPAGAAVYFKGSSQYGHVGISVGNGYFINAGGSIIKKEKLKPGMYSGYLGYGWHYNHKLSGDYNGTSNTNNYIEVDAEFTGYCTCKICCGENAKGITANGETANPKNKTCAAPKEIAFGTFIEPIGTNSIIDGVQYRVNDRGGAIKKSGSLYKIDILFGSHQEALNFGRRKGKMKIYKGSPYVNETSNDNETTRVIETINVDTSGITVKSLVAGEVKFPEGANLVIVHNNELQVPPLKGDVKWETERQGSAGKLTFTVLKSANLNFREGDPVLYNYNGKKIFFGYVFTKQRNKDGEIKVTAYDQLRYFKNKHTYVWSNINLGGILKTICKDFGLQYNDSLKVSDYDYNYEYATEMVGLPSSTGLSSHPITADKETLFDIVGRGINNAALYDNELRVVFDDYGVIRQSTPYYMVRDTLIVADTAQDYDYTTSVDEGTYNRVILTYSDPNSEVEQYYTALNINGIKNDTHTNQIGVLQYIEDLSNIPTDTMLGKTAEEVCKKLAKNLSRKTRKLTVKGCFGDTSVRAGCLVPVALSLGDTILTQLMLVDKCTHTFSDGLHTMDLVLIGGGDYVA